MSTSWLSERTAVRGAWILLGVLFALAFALNAMPGYEIALGVLAIASAVLAASSLPAAVILIAGTPALDSFGIIWTVPQVLTVFQVTLLAGIAGAAWRFVASRGWRRASGSWLDLGVGLFLVATAISVPFSLDVRRSIIGLLEIGALTGMYLLLSRGAMAERSGVELRRVLLSVAAISSAVAVGQAFIRGFPVPLVENFVIDNPIIHVRVSAFYGNPNSLAFLLVLATVVACESILRARTTGHRVGLGVLVALYAVAIALTFSREAFVGVVAGLIALALIAGAGRRALLVGVIASAVLVAALFAVPGVSERAVSIVNFRNDASAMDRVYLSRVSLRMFADRPLFGIGESAFMRAYPRYADPRVTISPVTDGHQMPFMIPAETGILGLIAELMVVLTAGYALVKARTHAPPGIRRDGLAALCAFLAMSFFNIFYYAEYFWVTLALVGAFLQCLSLAQVMRDGHWIGVRRTAAQVPAEEAAS